MLNHDDSLNLDFMDDDDYRSRAEDEAELNES